VASQLKNAVPLLSQEGWPEGPGWFQSDNTSVGGFGTTRLLMMSDSLRDPAALLTQEGRPPISN
jgi:hypothetical protein